MFGLDSASLAFVIWASMAVGLFDGANQTRAEIAVKRAAECGVGPVTIRYEDELKSGVLSAPRADSATESQLRCLDEATGSGIFVELPPSSQSRFDAIRDARASEVLTAEARRWLSQRGLLGRIPKYVAGATDDLGFTREVEALCGPRTEGAFQSRYGQRALSPEWISKLGPPPLSEKDVEAMSCLLNVTAVAGYTISFIGNETGAR